MQADDISKYEKPAVTVDLVVFTIQQNELRVLLIKRKFPPFENQWALPGGFVRISESVDAAAKRELVEETGVKDVYLEQLYTFGDLKRDPRGRVITVSYYALVNATSLHLAASTDAAKAEWHSVKAIQRLAFDHLEILHYALQRLKWKLEYTNVVYSLLPEKFTLTELQQVYETILGKKLEKRNFRKKIISLKLLKETAEYTKDVSHRPAQLYQFTQKKPMIIEVL